MHFKRLIFAFWLLALSSTCCSGSISLDIIRYRFTSCGKTGRPEPSIEVCEKYYSSRDSPITRDNVLFNIGNSSTGSYRGAQGFRVPRTALYNITVAGARGGKGICNIEAGKGVKWKGQVELSTDIELLILVGQNGTDPCSTGYSIPVCEYSPHTVEEADYCSVKWREYILYNASLAVPEYSINFTGGGGGGGASMMWPRSTVDGTFSQYPIIITGGGGGSSSLLDYSILDKLNISFEGDNGSITLEEKYRLLLNANESRRDLRLAGIFDQEGIRGYFPANGELIAGSGGGWSSRFYTVDAVGGFLSTEENFAEGGFDCARQVEGASAVVTDRDHGGFGAGGGQCGGGGGGVRHTGGSIYTNGNTVPGGGGYSYLTDTFEGLRNGSEYGVNDGEGYVEIIPADCGCAHSCIVYDDADQFQCICPNGTELAPDNRHCVTDAEITVTLKETFGVYDDRIFFTPILFEDGPFEMFSVSTELKVTASQENRLLNFPREAVCCIVFTGISEHTLRDSNEIEFILTTEPIRENDDGRVHNLAEMISVNGEITLSRFTTFLNTPAMVSGAFLVSTGDCRLEDTVMSVNTSIEVFNLTTPNNEDIDYATVGMAVLGISEPPDDASNKTANFHERTVLLSTLCSAVGVLTVAITILACGFCFYRRKKKKSRDNFCSPIPKPRITTLGRSFGTSSLATNAAYIKYGTGQVPVSRAVNPTAAMEEPMVLSYEVLDFDEEHAYASNVALNLSFSDKHFTPRYGIRAPLHDFYKYNLKRVSSGSMSTVWEFPRYKLVYLRELGEGQFGKVLLMKALGIAGYQRQIPVAVKTLSSRVSSHLDKFIQEAELMRNFCHPNIVSLLGLSLQDVDKDSAPLMIMEYMPFGDLLSFLKSHKPGNVRSSSYIEQHHFYGFARDIGSAMEFLASKKYVHRDLAARNCLVGTGLQVKIADFGLARGVHNKDYYRVAGKAVLPVRWMAPECLLYGKFVPASDAWSYGVVLWEIVTYGEMPLEQMTVEDIVQSAEKSILIHTRPPNCPEDLYAIMQECHRHTPEERPTFTTILSNLKEDSLNIVEVSVSVQA